MEITTQLKHKPPNSNSTKPCNSNRANAVPPKKWCHSNPTTHNRKRRISQRQRDPKPYKWNTNPPNLRIPLNPRSADQRQTLRPLLNLKNPRAKARLARERRGMCEEVRWWVRFDSQRAGGSQWSPKERADAASQGSPLLRTIMNCLIGSSRNHEWQGRVTFGGVTTWLKWKDGGDTIFYHHHDM